MIHFISMTESKRTFVFCIVVVMTTRFGALLMDSRSRLGENRTGSDDGEEKRDVKRGRGGNGGVIAPIFQRGRPNDVALQRALDRARVSGHPARLLVPSSCVENGAPEFLHL